MTSTETWMNDDLCSLAGDTVRIERGPQVIELDCTEANLSDEVTDRRYKLGKRDALGRLIDPDEAARRETDPKAAAVLRGNAAFDRLIGHKPLALGERMHCVDRAARHRPYVWKIYRMQEAGIDRAGNPISRFVKIEEVEGKDAALAAARKLAKGGK